MKKIILGLFAILLFVNTSKASHMLGGEITWVCQSNGKFVFYASIYKSCASTSAGYAFNNITMSVTGGPRGSNNQIISSIILRPDSNRWGLSRNGDINPICNGGITCAQGDPGATQAFWFESDPIQLKGTPPAAGWQFTISPPCCRGNAVINIAGASGATMGIRAKMYRIPNVTGGGFQTTDQCNDNSAYFAEVPAVQICRGYEFTFNHVAIDRDLDSLVYAFDTPISTAGTPLGWAAGYSQASPLPGTSFHPSNIPASLDPLTGEMKFAIYNGSGQITYATSIRCNTYRRGALISSVWREIPFILFTCPPIPGVNKNNRVPEILINGQAPPSGGYGIEVFAGEKIKISFQADDGDLTANNPPFQFITLEPSGFLFSTNFADSNICIDPSVKPCATLSPPPLYNGGKYQTTAMLTLGTEFNWQTDCNHISVNTGVGQVGVASGIFNFVMKTFDDHCPIPGLNYPTISVKVKAPIPLEEPIVKGLSIGLDDKPNLQWAPPIDSANTFEEYEIQLSALNNGTTPSYSPLGTASNYKFSKKPNQFINFPLNPYTPFPAGKDYYLRMRAMSGCTGDVPSSWSEPVRVIELDLAPTGTAPVTNSQATLTWNRPKPTNAATKPYFVYESPTRYYIYENQNMTNNANMRNPNNWVLIDQTYNTTYVRNSAVCDALVGFRIEARDTVITYKQGTRIPDNKFDTLVFSTFSIMNAMQMRTPGVVPPPTIDTMAVYANGDVFFKVNLGSAGTAGTFNFYETTNGSYNLIGTINPPQSTFVHVGANADPANPNIYAIESIDICDVTAKDTTFNYKTTSPAGDLDPLADPCDRIYKLTWNAPTGMRNNNIRYKVFMSVDGGAYSQIAGNLSARNHTISNMPGDKTYRFYIIAENNRNQVNISPVYVHYLAPGKTRELVQAPDVRCVEILPNGDVKITWIPPTDTTDNFGSYHFAFGKNPSSWTVYPNNAGLLYDDTTLTFTGVNAQTNHNGMSIRAKSLSGCDGTTSSSYDYTDVISLTVTANADKSGDIEWNDMGNGNPNPYRGYKDLSDPSNALTRVQRHSGIETNFIDLSNADVCDLPIYYIVEQANSTQNGTCLSVSNVASDVFIDKAPDIQLADFVTVNADNSVTVSWSTPSAIDIDSIEVVKSDGPNSLIHFGRVKFMNPGSFTIPANQPQITIVDSFDTFGLKVWDVCGKTYSNDNKINYHTTMDVDVYWNSCDSVMELSWTPYDGFNTGTGVEYDVVWDTSLTVSNPVGNEDWTQSLSYKFKVKKEMPVGSTGLLFTFYIRARATGAGADINFISRSNRAAELALYEDTPRYDYLHYSSVLDQNTIELQVLPDKSVFSNIERFVIYRGTDKADMKVIGIVPKTSVVDSTFRYYDYTGSTEEFSYFYKVIVQNTCGGPVDTSNYGRTLLLDVVPDFEALTNTLKWNHYEEWDSTVAYFNIYRSYNKGGFELYNAIAPSETDYNMFVDDVYDESKAIGDFCYMIEAVQGPVTTDFDIDQLLNPAVSRSNKVCVTMEPLFYIPNAFSPTGKNRMFAPEGQFFNWQFYEMIIYDRWGKQVFISNNVNKGWTGEVEGELAGLGSYVYTIRFKDADGNEHRRKGTVTVVR